MGYFFLREALNGVRFLPSASYLIRNMSYVTINLLVILKNGFDDIVYLEKEMGERA